MTATTPTTAAHDRTPRRAAQNPHWLHIYGQITTFCENAPVSLWDLETMTAQEIAQMARAAQRIADNLTRLAERVHHAAPGDTLGRSAKDGWDEVRNVIG